MNKINEELMKEFILASGFLIKPHGRPRGQERILRKLLGGPLDQKQLQEEMHVTPASISEIVRKMEDKGLLERNRNEEDARAVSLKITDEGKRFLEGLEEEEDLFSSISDEEKEELKSILTKLNNDWIRRGPIIPPEGRPGHGRGHCHHERMGERHCHREEGERCHHEHFERGHEGPEERCHRHGHHEERDDFDRPCREEVEAE